MSKPKQQNYRATILGCGSSGGVPRTSGDWGVCDPSEPRNRRMRCSLLLEYWEGEAERPAQDQCTIVLIDTSPDLRAQLLDAKISRLDAVLLTHDHADQTHGIDDLRAIAYTMRKRIPTYMDQPTYDDVNNKFGYCFEMPDGRQHPPILDHQSRLEHKKSIKINGEGGALTVMPLTVSHGHSTSLGFRFGPIAYVPDVHEIDEDSLDALTGLDVFIADALRYHDHPTHAHADRTLEWCARTQAKKLIMTNLHIDMDYAALKAELPQPHEPAYDGMTVHISL